MILQPAKIISSKECAEYARKKWVNINDLESVYAMYLNDRFEVECFKQINTGNYRESNFNARETMKLALFMNFDHVILFHNHTSGICKPSETDKKLTDLLYKVYEVFEVHLADHIIVTVNDHYSFADHGLINNISA